jgi:hypothetical protein
VGRVVDVVIVVTGRTVVGWSFVAEEVDVRRPPEASSPHADMNKATDAIIQVNRVAVAYFRNAGLPDAFKVTSPSTSCTCGQATLDGAGRNPPAGCGQRRRPSSRKAS